MVKEDKILIPYSDLENGFNQGRDQIEILLNSCESLYNSGIFPTSISLAIIALEEISKLKLIRDKIIRKEDIHEKEWKEFTAYREAHDNKILKPHHDARKKFQNMTEDKFNLINQFKMDIDDPSFYNSLTQAKTENPLLTKQLKTLKKIKESCFYFERNQNQWISFHSLHNKKSQKKFAYLMKQTSWLYFKSVLLYFRHRKISTDKNSQSYKRFVSDPLFQETKKINKEFKSRKFQQENTTAILEVFKKYMNGILDFS